MKNIISEYSNALYYAFICLISIILIFISVRLIVKNDSTPLKTITYNSDSYDADIAPIIRINNNVLIIDKDSAGYEDNVATLNTLKNNRIFDVTLNGESYTEYNKNKNDEEKIKVKIKGKINSAKAGTYNIEVIATNKYSTSTDGITVMVKDNNNSY